LRISPRFARGNSAMRSRSIRNPKSAIRNRKGVADFAALRARELGDAESFNPQSQIRNPQSQGGCAAC
jgi:hypothetical protein